MDKKETATINTSEEITPQQLFDSRNVLRNNSLKIMNGKFGGGFYVKYLQDEGSKTGFLQLIIEYPDKQCKAVLLCKNVFKETDYESEGIGTIEKGSGENITTLTPLRSTSLKDGDYRMLEKYETPQMPIPAQAIWKQIVDNYSKIPVITICKTEDIEGIYWRLYQIAHDITMGYNPDTDAIRENEIRFLVTKQEMEEVALENGYTLSQLRTEFNLMGLLVKDKGSTSENGKRYNSYQLTKKINGTTQRFYALKKIIKKAEEKIDESCMVDFAEEYLETPMEKELKQAKEEMKELQKQLKEKKKEISELYMNRIDDTTQKELLEKVLVVSSNL